MAMDALRDFRAPMPVYPYLALNGTTTTWNELNDARASFLLEANPSAQTSWRALLKEANNDYGFSLMDRECVVNSGVR